MHRGYTTPLVIAIMAFAIVSFLFLIDTAIMPANSNQVTNRVANKNTGAVVCTDDAKICPDGSAVGRSGPKCEFAECPTSTNTNSSTNANAGTPLSEDSENYPQDVAKNYVTKAGYYSFYQGPFDIFKADIVTPFSLADYHSAVTPYGALFWKKGETQQTRFASFGDQDISYENGVQPDFRWYDFKRKEFVTLPNVGWKTGDALFDRVFAVYASTSQPRIAIEIGQYDIKSNEFEPGLIDSQPVKSRGLHYNPVLNVFESDNSLDVFLSVLELKTTQWHGFTWDSKSKVAVAVPGGEGCGPAPTLSFVHLDSKEATQVPDLRNTEGWGGFDYTEDQCNPHNGRSPDGQWLVLYGKTTDGQWAFRLFQPKTFDTVVKTVRIPFTSTEDFLKEWDTTMQYPKIILEKGSVIDFNK